MGKSHISDKDLKMGNKILPSNLVIDNRLPDINQHNASA
jgi:hypothetical protein